MKDESNPKSDKSEIEADSMSQNEMENIKEAIETINQKKFKILTF